MTGRKTRPEGNERALAIDGKSPPADIEAEASILGALMFDARHLATIPATLTPRTFYSEAHARIFEAITDLVAERVDVSAVTVGQRLRETARMGQVGVDTLLGLVDGTAILTPSMFDRLVRVVLNKATLREASRVLHEALAVAYADADCDPSALLADTERKLQALSIESAAKGLRHASEFLRPELNDWKDRADGRGTFGIPTGFREVDKATAGLHRGDLDIIAARPGMGKTSFITACVVNVAHRGHDSAIFSLEMPGRQLAGRMMCTQAGLSVIKARAGRLDAHELARAMDAESFLRQLGIWIDDAEKGRPTIADIVSRSRRLAADLARKGRRLGLIVVDYIQIVKLSAMLVKQRHELAIGEVSTELKSLAKELDTTVIGVAQLNRGVESRNDKRPGMADLRDSGQIEQDADVIAFLYRDEYYRPESAEKGVVEFIIEKQRNGPTGTVKLAFDGPTTRFADLDEERGVSVRMRRPRRDVPPAPSFYERPDPDDEGRENDLTRGL